MTLPLLFAWSWPTVPDLLHALPVIISLILIEGLLSVDNALAIAAMANHLPPRQRVRALRWGIIGAYVFRGLALLFAYKIIEYPALKMAGALYLIYLLCEHFTKHAEKSLDPSASSAQPGGFIRTIVAIEVMDLSLSVDNVVAAVALSPKLWVVCTGVFIGILVLRFVAGWCLKLLEKYPILEHAAFLLIGFIGVVLVVELSTDWHISPLEKFAGIVVILTLSILYGRSPSWQQKCAGLFRWLLYPMRLISMMVGTLLRVLAWPFRRIYASLRPRLRE